MTLRDVQRNFVHVAGHSFFFLDDFHTQRPRYVQGPALAHPKRQPLYGETVLRTPACSRANFDQATQKEAFFAAARPNLDPIETNLKLVQ